jgi:hypothetical protein
MEGEDTSIPGSPGTRLRPDVVRGRRNETTRRQSVLRAGADAYGEHWARLQAGKTVLKRPLPPRGLGMSDTVTIGENAYESYEAMAARLLAEPIPARPTFSEELPQVEERGCRAR